MAVKAASERTARLLVTDDDARLRRLLAATLSKHGFWTEQAASVAEAEALRQTNHYDLMVLDVMMPDETGIEWVTRLRAAGDTIPVLLLTALGEAPQRIEGFRAGADDYLAKPFEPDELVLRLHAILRRLPPPPVTTDEYHFGDFRFHAPTRQLWQHTTPVPLTGVESDVLFLLAERKGQTVSRREIAQLMGNDTDSRAVDVTITRLRRKMGESSKNPGLIMTMRGEGYCLVCT